MSNDSALEAEISSRILDSSREYVGRWNLLVSTTNWEKGRIIVQWRDALRQAGEAVACCTDEAWAEQVGGVTPQHVGRLRRVFERFAPVCQDYPGLYWSHFHAALDWPDAEMWLEGAVQNDWSVAGMRNNRWEALGEGSESKPMESEIVFTESDEGDVSAADRPIPDSISEKQGEVRAAGDSDEQYSESQPCDSGSAGIADAASAGAEAAVPFRPFEKMPPMPADISEAFELFKLAVISHKISGWRDMALDDVLAILDALKQLALAPAE
jgi:hypothetical protein